jgi:hypothetical protein
MEAYRGKQMYSTTHALLGAKWKWVVTAKTQLLYPWYKDLAHIAHKI